MNLQKTLNVLRMGEGFIPRPYKCTEGKWTWGIGRNYEDYPLLPDEKQYIAKTCTMPVDVSKTWTVDMTTFILSNIDSAQAERVAHYLAEHAVKIIDYHLSKTFDWYCPCDDVRKSVWIDWSYNMGLWQVKGFSNSSRLMACGEYAQLAEQAKSWKWAAQVHYRKPSPNDPYGGRAWWITEMMRSGNWPSWS